MTMLATKQKSAGYINALVVAFLVNLFSAKYVLADVFFSMQSPAPVHVSENGSDKTNNLDCLGQKLADPIYVNDLINDRYPSYQIATDLENVFEPASAINCSRKDSPPLINVSDTIKASEQSLSFPVIESIKESKDSFDRGVQEYQEGQFFKAESSFKLALERLNRDRKSRFYLDKIEVSSRMSVKFPESLDWVYLRIINSLAMGDNTAKELNDLFLEYIERIFPSPTPAFSIIINDKPIVYNIPNLPNQETKINNLIETSRVEDAHQLEIEILRFLQKALISQKQNKKIEEALEIAQLTSHLEQTRMVPAIVYALNSEFLHGNQVIDNRLPELIEPDLLSLEDIKDIARKQDATLVNYSVVSDKEIFVWIIQPTGQVDFKEIDLASIDASLESFSKSALQAAASFVDRGEEDKAAFLQAVRQLKPESHYPQTIANEEQEKVLHELYQKLINPIKSFLPKNPDSHVIFVPQAALILTPFPALKDVTGQYLIEQHTIRIAPNLQAIAQNKPTLTQFPRRDKILIVGNPANPEIGNLPGAELEARSLGIMSASHPLIGSQATSETVLQGLSDANVIHLATHGILDAPLSPIDIILVQDGSSIARFEGQTKSDATNSKVWYSLWPNNKTGKVWHMIRINGSLPGAVALSDRLLTSQEILNLKSYFKNADLVVLSACNTAQGQIVESNILGLPFSLGIAGVPNVVVSLWAVPDKSTEMLMYEFYSEMRKQDAENREIDIAKALRKAMLKVKNVEEYRDPIYWAGFLLMNVSQ